MRIDHAESLRRGREYFKTHGYPMASDQSVSRIAELIDQAVRDTVEECAQIALEGVDPRAVTPKMLTKRTVAMEIRAAFPIGARSVTESTSTEQAPTAASKGDIFS